MTGIVSVSARDAVVLTVASLLAASSAIYSVLLPISSSDCVGSRVEVTVGNQFHQTLKRTQSTLRYTFVLINT